MNQNYTQYPNNIFITKDTTKLLAILNKTPFNMKDIFDAAKEGHSHFMGKDPLSCEGEELVFEYQTQDGGKNEIAIYNDGFNANIKIDGVFVGYKPFKY